jgi:tRNA G18 (ribose-2'-O)-methylase SpoU
MKEIKRKIRRDGLTSMNSKKIYSKNAIYQKFEVLKTNRNKRHKYNEFFIEGVRNINEAVKNNWVISSFIYNGDKALSDWAGKILNSVQTDVNYELSADLMADISSKEDTSELLAIVRMREDDLSALKLSDNPLLILFDRPSNKGNLGTIIRSCDSFGVDGLIITGHAVDLYDPAVIAATMGSFFNMPSVRVPDHSTLFAYLDDLKNRYPRLQIVGTTAHNETVLTDVDFTRPTVIMIGNETDGLNHAFKDRSDVLATIPMNGTSSASSFNVGCAATVFLYEAVRQRM